MTSKDLYALNQKSKVRPIRLSNPHPYPITLDLFNDFSGTTSSYYHEIKTATPRLASLQSGEEIVIENALFVKVLGGDVEVTDLDSNVAIVYNGDHLLLEHGFNLFNQIKIKAIASPVSLIWTKGELFVNDSATNPKGICAMYFHPSTTDFYHQPLRWIKQDSFGKKSTESIHFDDFGPHFKNKAYLLTLKRTLSITDSFQLVLPPQSSLSIYLYHHQDCSNCLPIYPCDLEEEQPAPFCPEPAFPFWLKLLLGMAALSLLFFRFKKQNP